MPKHTTKSKPDNESADSGLMRFQDDIFERSPYRLAFHIHDVSRLRKTVLDQLLKPHGVTRSQWWVLANLARNRERTLSQVELGRVLDMGKASIGSLVHRMESAGLVARVSSPDDGRAKHVMLTDQGLQKLRLMTEIAAPTNEKIVEGISGRDLRVATKVLSTMKHNLKNIFAEEDERQE